MQELLHEVDERPWQTLAKRRVQHYGYEFLYKVLYLPLSCVLHVGAVFLYLCSQKLAELLCFLDSSVLRMTCAP